ncbi:MAG: universal stress protein [Trichlorobacter sp.]|jgi:universal stress protein A|nr:universal stress protein [Trichlorobacter sp.]
MQQFKTILLATDFSESSIKAAQYALSMARCFNARLLVLHVINEPVDLRGFYVPHITFEKLEKEIETSAAKMMEKFCAEQFGDFEAVETALVTGIPFEEILFMTDERSADLIVIGTHGRTGLDHLIFGSTAERVVRSASCPVMTVRYTGE